METILIRGIPIKQLLLLSIKVNYSSAVTHSNWFCALMFCGMNMWSATHWCKSPTTTMCSKYMNLHDNKTRTLLSPLTDSVVCNWKAYCPWAHSRRTLLRCCVLCPLQVVTTSTVISQSTKSLILFFPSLSRHKLHATGHRWFPHRPVLRKWAPTRGLRPAHHR